MTELPPDELAALPEMNMPGFVLELGNKKNSTGLYRDWYHANGIDYECIDWNGHDGAWKFDMRQPGIWQDICATFHDSRDRFPLVTNFGFTEHVGETLEEQIECWRNVHELVAVGGTLSMCMPIMPYWKGHGRWMPTELWYDEFHQINGYSVERMQTWDRVRPTMVCRFVKEHAVEFTCPASEIKRSDL